MRYRTIGTDSKDSAEQSRQRLGMARLDLLYAHIEDPVVPLRGRPSTR
jgi:aryl-alcohol dehydrogenase-like predicted oxidoreductase